MTPPGRRVSEQHIPPDSEAQDRAPSAYNYARFTRSHLVDDVVGTLAARGVRPGELAPDFELPRSDGRGQVRLSALRDRPVLLHFTSYT